MVPASENLLAPKFFTKFKNRGGGDRQIATTYPSEIRIRLGFDSVILIASTDFARFGIMMLWKLFRFKI